MTTRKVIILALASMGGGVTSLGAQPLSTYGTPGLIDMPTATSLPDGSLAFTIAQDDVYRRQTASFQLTPRLTAAFRYTNIDGLIWGGEQRENFDRNFDLHFRLLDEGAVRPAFAIGVRDMIGTGLFAGEYVVATKSLPQGVAVSAGLGWGRLGERDGFSNPLSVLSSDLDVRGTRAAGDQGGTLRGNAWFRGDAAFFGGVSWQSSDRLTMMMEYSSDLYEADVARGGEEVSSPVNLGLRYAFGPRGSLTAQYLRGNTVGVSYSFALNPSEPFSPAGLEGAPPDPGPRYGTPSSVEAASTMEARLKAALADQGLVLRGLSVRGERAEIRVFNRVWESEAQAFGRAARVMAATLPGHIREFDIVFMQADVPITRISLSREDLHDLEFDLEGDWRLLGRVDITDAHQSPVQDSVPGTWPRYSLRVAPFLEFSLFDPDNPFRYDTGVALSGQYRPMQGLTLSGILRYPLASTLDDAPLDATSELPRVRSNYYRYAAESEAEIRQLAAEYMFRPGQDWFGRVSAGYLEPMFGGVSAELLHQPIGSRVAFGVELNYAKQRDFDMLLGFQDYDVVTGHLSNYYRFGDGYKTQLDVGRYLAGDWGGTMALSREFGNGIEVGGFFTLTDVPFSDFGEGSFDKGITLEIPFSVLTGQPSRRSFARTLRPVLRDGGARLSVSNRLYDVVDPYRTESLEANWGRVFR